MSKIMLHFQGIFEWQTENCWILQVCAILFMV